LLWAGAQIFVSKESFRPYLLKPLEHAKAKTLLVDKILDGFNQPVFTPEEFEIVWEYSGGHQGTIYTLHNMICEGQTVAAAIEEQKRQDFNRLARTLEDEESTTKTECEKWLVALHNSKYSLYLNELKDPAVLHLLKSNILFTDGKVVQPQSRPVEHVIREYLNCNPSLLKPSSVNK